MNIFSHFAAGQVNWFQHFAFFVLFQIASLKNWKHRLDTDRTHSAPSAKTQSSRRARWSGFIEALRLNVRTALFGRRPSRLFMGSSFLREVRIVCIRIIIHTLFLLSWGSKGWLDYLRFLSWWIFRFNWTVVEITDKRVEIPSYSINRAEKCSHCHAKCLAISECEMRSLSFLSARITHPLAFLNFELLSHNYASSNLIYHPIKQIKLLSFGKQNLFRWISLECGASCLH